MQAGRGTADLAQQTQPITRESRLQSTAQQVAVDPPDETGEPRRLASNGDRRKPVTSARRLRDREMCVGNARRDCFA